jgi:mono/diheme cytochrome c family protein/sugar lactone lactonase YvrE
VRTQDLCIVVSLLAACGSVPQPRAPGPRPKPAVTTAAAPEPPVLPYLTGSRIADTLAGAVVIDADSGALMAVDVEGRAIGQQAIARGAGQLVLDPERGLVFVADRMNDQIVVANTRDALAVTARWKTPAEPFGVALTPDRQTLLVTTVADRTLVALDATTGVERWHSAIAAGSRSVAVSPDGTLALVGSIATGSLELVELTGEHRVATLPFDLDCARCEFTGAFARGSGSVRFIGAHRAIATFQRSIPESLVAWRTAVYGGSGRPPVTQHVAFLTFSIDPKQPGLAQSVAQIVENQPRSIAWDAAHDTLFIAGLGSDSLMALHGISNGDQDAIAASAASALLGTSGRCGPDGMTLSAGGDLLVWCSFTRTVLRLRGGDVKRAELTQSRELVASSFTPDQHSGLELFYTTNTSVNTDHALACASCHLEGTTDGLSWKIGEQALQTPLLAGRLAGTHPFKWSGSDKVLSKSLATTITRLGGAGLSDARSKALVAFLESLPRPRTPSRDAAAVARGSALFAGAAGCATCHGGPMYTDRDRHQFESTLVDADTPSLIGVGSSAPYYHDGSAATLDDLLRGGGAVHGMAELAELTAAQRADLRTFLESL